MAKIRSSGTWGSSLTSGEFAAIRSAGFEPVGQVLGAAVYAAGAASGSYCPAAGGSPGGRMPGPSAAQVPGQGGPGSFGPLVEAMYQARRTAIAGFSPAGRCHAGPALAVMSLDAQRHQAASGRI